MSQLMGNIGFNSQQSNTNSNSNYSTNGSTNTQRTLTPGQSGLLDPTFEAVINAIQNPTGTLAPYKTAAVNNVNQNYAGLADTLRQQFLGNGGGGQSGKFGMSLAQGNLNRLSDINNAAIRNSRSRHRRFRSRLRRSRVSCSA